MDSAKVKTPYLLVDLVAQEIAIANSCLQLLIIVIIYCEKHKKIDNPIDEFRYECFTHANSSLVAVNFSKITHQR